MNIGSVIKKRMSLQGMAKNALCENIGTSYTQLLKFLDNQSNLSISSLNNCFEQLGINIEMYGKRADLAKEVAKKLIDEGIDENDILSMDKFRMAKITNLPNLCDLFDLPFEDSIQSEEVAISKLQQLFKSEIVDVESTYLHFKCLVLYAMRVKDSEFSAPNTRTALKELVENRKQFLKEFTDIKGDKTAENNQRSRERLIELTNQIAPEESIIAELPILEKGKKPKQTGAENLYSTSATKTLSLLTVSVLTLIGSALLIKGGRIGKNI